MTMNGRYVPQEVLGIGTYGRVLRCIDTFTGKQVAVKVAQRDAAYRRSAMNEIRVLQLLSNSDVVLKMQDFFEHDGHLCIVSELLRTDLYGVLRKNSFQPFSLDAVCIIGERVLQALAELHKVGYMHCDIKPANVMLHFSENEWNHLDEYKKTRLIDFGAVRQFHENRYYDVQSLWYRAPEVILGVPYTMLIDSWSVGCLLLELYTGTPLFSGETPRDQMTAIMCTVGMPSMKAMTTGVNVGNLQLPCLAAEVNAESNIRRLIANHRSNVDDSKDFYQTTGEITAFVNLLCALLQPDERLRISCGDALHHSFFASRSPHWNSLRCGNNSSSNNTNNNNINNINSNNIFLGHSFKIIDLQSSCNSVFGSGFSPATVDASCFACFDPPEPPLHRPQAQPSSSIPSNSCHSVSTFGMVSAPGGGDVVFSAPASLPVVLPERVTTSPQMGVLSSHVFVPNMSYSLLPMRIMQPPAGPFHTQQ